MPDKKENNLIIDLLQEVREEQKTQSVILTEVQIDLAEHKEGVILNREEIKEHRTRLRSLEEPREAFKLLRKYLIGLGGMAAAVLGILKFLNYL